MLTILLFGRKKDSAESKPSQPPASATAFPVPDILRKTVTDTDLTKARDRLRIASLERDIIGDALTKIYEAESKGLLTEIERAQLVQRYKVDVKRVDGEIDIYKKVVDLHELESAREDLLKSFNEKLLEIDARINQIRPATQHTQTIDFKPNISTTLTPAKTENDDQAAPSSQTAAQKEKQAREKPKNKAEERLEAMREEVLKAMERLEQIETEG